jgi:hypothetical protein
MKTDNRPYWIPFKLCLGPAFAIIISVSYYVQNLGLTISGYTRVYCTSLGDKTIMESIYRLVRHQEKMVLAMQLVISYSLSTGGINDSHE